MTWDEFGYAVFVLAVAGLFGIFAILLTEDH